MPAEATKEAHGGPDKPSKPRDDLDPALKGPPTAPLESGSLLPLSRPGACSGGRGPDDGGPPPGIGGLTLTGQETTRRGGRQSPGPRKGTDAARRIAVAAGSGVWVRSACNPFEDKVGHSGSIGAGATADSRRP
jgi:hypothetical protein